MISDNDLEIGQYIGREGVIKTKYSEKNIWDLLISSGNPTDFAKEFLVKDMPASKVRATMNRKTLLALIVKKHINIDKTLKSFEWRIAHLYHIRDKDGQIVTFKLNEAQEDFIENRWYRNVILKSRQLGFSTMALILGFDEAYWNPYKNNIIVAHKVDDAKKLFRRIEFAYNTMPEFLKEFTYLKSKTA